MRGNGADCHHYGEPAAAAAISNSCGRGTKQPAGAKYTYTNVQAGNAGRRHKGARPKSRIVNWLQCDTESRGHA